MIVVGLVFLGVVGVVWFRARRRRMLAGLMGDRPVFHVEPPVRRMGSRKRECL